MVGTDVFSKDFFEELCSNIRVLSGGVVIEKSVKSNRAYNLIVCFMM